MTRFTKRPHFVPRGYMRAWANDSEQIAVRRREAKAAYPANIGDVAVQGDIYGGGEVGQRREELFGKVEQTWPRLRDSLIESGMAVGEDHRDIAIFIALQISRTREHIAQLEFVLSLAESTDERPLTRDAVRQFLTTQHLGFTPAENEVEGAWTIASYAIAQGDLPTREELLGTSLDIAVSKLAPAIEAMHWTVETCRRPILMSSDRPVMYWRPPSNRDEIEGVGLLGASEVRLPLNPRSLLVLRRIRSAPPAQRVEPSRFDEVNQTTAAQCFEFVMATVTQRQRLSSIDLARQRPSLRFNFGPLVDGESGTDEPRGEIVHSWIPSPSR